MTGLWAVALSPTFHRSIPHTFHHVRVITTLAILMIALFTAGYSLLLTVQYDNPDMAEFYREYYANPEQSYPAYFASAIRAIRLNNAIARRKSRLLLVSTLSLFLGYNN